MNKPQHRPYAKPEFLIRMYRFMEAYYRANKFPVSIAELVTEGFSPSTSVIRYYLTRMVEFHMIERPSITLPDGRIVTPARGIVLLPLEGADPIITNLLPKKEKVHE